MDRLRALAPLFFLLAAGALATGVALAYGITPKDVATWIAGVSPWVQDHRVLGASLFVLILAAVVASAMPGSILLTVTGGALFGTALALPLALIGELSGSAAIFLASRRAFQSTGHKASQPGGPVRLLIGKIRHGYQKAPGRYATLLCAIPVLPSGGLSIALAWLGCPVRTFLLASTLGRGVMLACETGLGSGLNHALAGEGFEIAALLQPAVLLPLAGFVALLLIPTALQRLHRPPVLAKEDAQ